MSPGRPRCFGVLVCVSALAVTVHPPAPALSQAAPPVPDLDALARVLVEESARVQDGELVWIQGGTEVLELMERVAVAVGRVGGQPLVTVFSNDMLLRWYEQVPAWMDQRRDEWWWRLPETAHVLISFDTFDPEAFAAVDPDRFAAWDEANLGLLDHMGGKGVRVVWVGNSLFPAPGRARGFGMDEDELETLFWDGVLTSPSELARTGGSLRRVLEEARTIRITDPAGTDLTLRPGPGTVVVTDGSTMLPGDHDDPEPRLNMTWLPGGEVTVGVDPGRADGRLVVPEAWMGGEPIRDLSLTWSAGRLVAMDSPSDLSRLRRAMEADPPLSRAPTGLKFGINPRITDPRAIPLMGAGMVSVSLGSNLVLGGTVDLPFILFLTLTEATVTVDGREVVRGGRLLVGSTGSAER
jgi:leucyl aminopeptidase (aminopeptidase T)